LPTRLLLLTAPQRFLRDVQRRRAAVVLCGRLPPLAEPAQRV